ncbi:HNH endonuclease [Rhodococcoides kyotonense]|uniref:HNH endonuclease n=2 Tax=Rhodococcoides kyotonense TaxID=398843 RepID=A0A239KWW2_9NOCA|nr:HNH endonuclease [Rhodococcus kyotonensis]
MIDANTGGSAGDSSDESWRRSEKELLQDAVALSQRIQDLEIERIRLVRAIDDRVPAEVLGFKNVRPWLVASTLLDNTAAGRILALARGLKNHKQVSDAFDTGSMPIDLAVMLLGFCEEPPAKMPDEAMEPALAALIAAATGPRANRDVVRAGIKTLEHIFDSDDPPPSEDLDRNTLHASTTMNGRVAVKADLDAATGEQFLTALSALSKPVPAQDGTPDPRTPAKRRADGFTELVERYLAAGNGPSEGGEKPHINLHIRADHLADIHRTRNHETRDDETRGSDDERSGDEHCWNSSWDNALHRLLAEEAIASLTGRDAPADWDITGGWDPTRSEALQAKLWSLGDTWTEADHWAAWGEQMGASSGSEAPNERVRDTSFYRDLIADAGVGWVPWTGPVTVTTARRLSCDCILTPMFLDENRVPLNLGNTERTATRKQRRALVARDHGCAFPGCTQPPAWTHAHHIKHWIDGGATDLDNLVLLCGHHHRMLHHSDWEVVMGTDRHPEFIPPASVDPFRRPVPSNRSPRSSPSARSRTGP